MPYPFTAVIVKRAVSATPDAYNADVLEEVERITTPAYREQYAPGTDGAPTDAAVTDWAYQFPPGPTIDIEDQIEQGGVTYEIIGDPELVVHPWSGADDHWEVRCRRLRYV